MIAGFFSFFKRRNGIILVCAVILVIGAIGVFHGASTVHAQACDPATQTCPPTPTQPPSAPQANREAQGDGGIGVTIARGISSVLIEGVIKLMGGMLTSLVSGLIIVSSYSDFVNSLAVVNGWVIVRDVANMFFIVVLLVIAFGTILGQEEYHYKKLLPKLLIMAVVVNFSRTIMGLMIDFSQVVMLTFVNGYSAAAGGNFANAFKITQLLQFNPNSCGTGAGPWEILGAALLALFMITVSVITVFVMLAVLMVRIIMLWILTVLSPIAFLAGTFPQGQKYYAEWWEEFKGQVLVGPVLAFFLWLSLITIGGSGGNQLLPQGQAVPDAIQFGCSAVGDRDVLMSFFLGTMMLLAGTQMAQKMGGEIGNVMGKAKGAAIRALKFGAGVADRTQGLVTGVQFSKIPERVSHGFEQFTKKTEQKIQDKGLRYAEGAQHTIGAIPVLGRPLAAAYTSLVAPDAMIETLASGGVGGIASRALRGVMGHKLYEMAFLEPAKEKRDEAGRIDTDLANQKRVHDTSQAQVNDIERFEALETLGGGRSPDEDKEFDKLQKKFGPGATAATLAPEKALHQGMVDAYLGPAAAAFRTGRVAESRQLRGEATKSEEQYARGTTKEYEEKRKQLRFQRESEANKAIDPSKTPDELIGELERAIGIGNKDLVSQLSKYLAQKGSIKDILNRFGIQEEGPEGLHKYRKQVLEKQVGLDHEASMSTAAAMSNHAWTSGEREYGSAYKVDPITDHVTERNAPEVASTDAKRMEGERLESLIQTLKPAALLAMGADGKERFSSFAAALLARMNSESPENLERILKRGFPPSVTKILKGQLGVLRDMKAAGALRPEIVNKIEAADVAPPGPSAADLVVDIMARIT